MLIADYQKKFPDEKVYCVKENPYIIEQGMLEFTEDSADCWAGPFNERWAYYSVSNGHLLHRYRNYPLLSIAEAKEQARLSSCGWPSRFRLTERSVMSEHKVQLMFSQMNKEEIKNKEHHIENSYKDYYTLDTPFRLYMCGNDDCSYSKFYPNLEQLREELAILEACQPLEMTDIHNLGFVFTN